MDPEYIYPKFEPWELAISDVYVHISASGNLYFEYTPVGNCFTLGVEEVFVIKTPVIIDILGF